MSQPPPPMPPASPSPISQPCSGCGAHLEFAPARSPWSAPTAVSPSRSPPRPVPCRSTRLSSWWPCPQRAAELAPHHLVCSRCGAHTLSDALSSHCQFCSPLVVDTSEDPQIVPEAVVPFTVDRSQARKRSARDAEPLVRPQRLKVADAETMKSTYLPHWTSTRIRSPPPGAARRVLLRDGDRQRRPTPPGRRTAGPRREPCPADRRRAGRGHRPRPGETPDALIRGRSPRPPVCRRVPGRPPHGPLQRGT